ncbi:hypothetical protein [Neobacillus drentensis]|uniref:hypothetical protein n=1 Tax=Neobacillus drentensis TaxID=220684 RepID=UPI002FFF40F6
MKKRFGIDIDGTVTCPKSILPYINKAFGLNLLYENVNQYEYTPFLNVPEKEFANWFTENEPVIYANSPLAEGAENVLKKWEHQHELFFISARRSHLLDITINWFIDKGLTFDHIELIGSHDKIATIKKHGVDLFFEDKHDNAVMINEECDIPVILFDTPYNQEPIPNGVLRVKNWREAGRWVDEWIKQEQNRRSLVRSN